MSIAKIIRILISIMVWTVSEYALANENMPDRLRHLQKQLSGDTENVSLLKEIGYIYMSQGDFVNSIAIGQKLIDISHSTDDRDEAELYGHIFIGCSSGGTNMTQPEAYKHLEQVLNIAEQNNDREALVSIYNAFGVYYSKQREDIYLTLYYMFKALDMARQLNDQRRYAILLSNISANYAMRGDVTGLPYAEEAYELASNMDDAAGMFYSAFSLAFCMC